MPGSHRSKVLFAGLLIDGTGRDPISEAAVVITGDQISQVGPRARITYDRQDTEIVDVSDKTLTPGLIDAHCHIFYFGLHFRERSVVTAIARAIRNAGLWLDKGVTTARDMSTRENLDIGLRDAINAGLVRGPRLFVSGLALAMTGAKEELRELVIEVTGPDEARRATRQQLRAGVDLIKLFSTGGLREEGAAQLTTEEMRAAVEEAHKAGKKVAAHAIGSEGIRNALEAGVDTIEHGMFLDEDIVKMMSARDIPLVPTLSLTSTIVTRGQQWGNAPEYIDKARRVLQAHRNSVRLAHEAGVKIAVGTDPVYDDTVAMECAALHAAGLSQMEVIVAATRSAAELIGVADKLGTLEEGKIADLVALGGNPLEDIRAMEKVDYVMKAGEIVKITGEIMRGCAGKYLSSSS